MRRGFIKREILRDKRKLIRRSDKLVTQQRKTGLMDNVMRWKNWREIIKSKHAKENKGNNREKETSKIECD